MRLDFSKAETPTEFDAEVCVIGAGAAGYTMARELAKSGVSVVMVAGGREGIHPAEQSLYEADVSGKPYVGHLEGRFRTDGGSTARWGGQLLPLEAQDFAVRDWIPHSGWPVDGAELEPFYRRALDLMGTETENFDESVYAETGRTPPPFDPERVVVRFAQWSRGTRRNFAEFLRSEIDALPVQVLLDAHVLRLIEEGGRIVAVEIGAMGGRRGRVTARTFVLAAGGIENPRLLLASGVGNAHDLVGRFYQDHLSFVLGRFAPEDAPQVKAWFQPVYNSKGILRTIKLATTAKAQAEDRVLNVMALVAFPFPETSAPMAARRILAGLRGRPRRSPNPKDLLQALVGAPDLVRIAFNQIVLKRRAIPGRPAAELVINMEQAPNRESRITLADGEDALGVPRARIHWSLTELERRTLRAYVRTFDTEWRRMGMRPILWEPYALEETDDYHQVVGDIYHHIGGTRMAERPEEGVVDHDLRVFGVENLYIAGSSVFPTGGSSNPTLTLLALAFRLADRIKATARIERENDVRANHPT